MTKLILVRHGESLANEKGIFVGHTDVELTARGYKQAEITAKYIASKYVINALYTSDLKRAYKTGKAIAKELCITIKTEKDLREIYGGEWEEHTFDRLQVQFSDDYSVWLKDIGKSRCTGGESVKQLGNRISRVITRIAEENVDKTVVIVTHGTPIRVMQCLCSRQTLGEMKEIPFVSNASITIVDYHGGGKFEVIENGVDEHLKEIRTVLPDNV